MGQNAIEIILDTSESMNELISTSNGEIKFELAKKTIQNLIEWDMYDCNYKLYIRFLENSRIITIENIDEIEKIEPKEQLPLFQVIESSINNLNNIKERYRNKIIYDRAYQVKKIFSDLNYTNILAEYDDNFFMRNMNKQLGETLWKALDLNETIHSLMIEFDIKENYDVKNIRKHRPDIQKKIGNKKTDYVDRFALFRNVIVLIKD